MAVEYGLPAYWATFTCNETGWSDLHAACGGEHHSQRPVGATRQYNRRWQAFLKKYLSGQSPIGDITRVWAPDRAPIELPALADMEVVHPTTFAAYGMRAE